METIRQYLTCAGVTAADGLMEKFYLSLKARPFVMVLGRGDTDMAALPAAFAAAVGANRENGRYLQLQVPMDWMDSSDLFGHLNLEGNFVPGAIIDFLKAAQNDPEKPYFLCFDRVNLSRAEYYLREILVSVEKKAPLVPVIYYGTDEKALETYGLIPALDNLYIIGTSNLDEASLPLNQKLLDKVHTVYLQPGDLTAGEQLAAGEEKPNSFLQCRYDNVSDHLEQAQEYFPLFEKLNKILTEATAYMGYQLRNDAVVYLMNNDVLPRQDAEDQMICQKVLTRLQGGKKLLPVLEKLLAVCQDTYPKATQALHRMIRQCQEEEFTSYWG